MNRKKSITLLLLTLTALAIGVYLIKTGLGSVVSTQKASLEPPPVATTGAQLNDQTYLVTRVVDGDTVEVSLNGQIWKVRYIGIDTPETVDPRRPVGCFGKEASAENKRLVEGKQVWLQKDVSETDKYSRLLRYVYLKTEGKVLFVNDYLVRAGFAKVSTYPPDVKFSTQFIQAEREAREGGRGLWQKC